MDDAPDDMNFAWSLTLGEMLEIVIEHCDLAMHSSEPLKIGVHLKMASRALRCALEVYGSAIEVPNQGPKV
jgi:hypothetical protein